jgi:hypothetical protein
MPVEWSAVHDINCGRPAVRPHSRELKRSLKL